MSGTIKLIELDDKYQNKDTEFPYIHSIKSKIWFRLRSKITYDHQPYLLIEKLQHYEYLLPKNKITDIQSEQCSLNFIVIKGVLTDDGAWIAQLPTLQPGVVSFQVGFTKISSNLIYRYGTHDIILLTQDKVELRKLRKMTVFPRCIGRHTKWVKFFSQQFQLGYNSFHLAPIQQTGASNSYYSLKSHLQLSNQLFSGTSKQKNQQLCQILNPLKQKGIVFFIDIILNHTSFDSDWIKDSPESVFTCQNTPMLYPAYLVDRLIYQWGNQVKQMMTDIELTQELLNQIQQNLKGLLEGLKIQEYFQLEQKLEFQMLAAVQPRKPSENIFAKDPIESIQQFLNENVTSVGTQRFGVSIKDIRIWKQANIAYEPFDLNIAIKTYNDKWRKKIQTQWIPEIISNTISSIRHEYLENSYRTFDDPWPLVNRYFSRIISSQGQQFFALNNGWVSGANSTQMFATSKQCYYLRRRVNAWGDLLRIRYGEKPADSSVAWKHMVEYVQQMARYFDGFRMDNLHGTQLNVASYMIKEARKVNPGLIVFAELFTSNDSETATFVRKVGINSMLKEAQHLLSGPSLIHYFHRRVQKTKPYLGSIEKIFTQNETKIKYSCRKRPITLIYDLTHDNKTYISNNIHILQTPVTFCLSLIGTFTGSTKGYDQFYSKKIMVTEMRDLYSQDFEYPPIYDKSQISKKLIVIKTKKENVQLFGSWNDWKQPQLLTKKESSQIQCTTLELSPGSYQYKFKCGEQWFTDTSQKTNNNGNHSFSFRGGQQSLRVVYRNLEEMRRRVSKYAEKYFNYREYHVYHNGNIVIIIREQVNNLKSICVIINLSTQQEPLSSNIKLPGEIIYTQIWRQTDLSVFQGQVTQSQVINSYNLSQFFDIQAQEGEEYGALVALSLPPGFSCLIECQKNKNHRQTLQSIDQLTNRQIYFPPMNALDYNRVFFNAAREQQVLYGQSNYVIPGINKQLVYAGFAGIFQIVKNAKMNNQLDHPLFQNLKQGNWLLNYYLDRLRRYKNLQDIVDLLERVFLYIEHLPKYLIPKYFCRFIYKLMLAAQNQSCSKNTNFQKQLSFAANQFINSFPNSNLKYKITISAGLPHFSVGWARCWGRDTFTSNELLLKHPNIYKQIILQFASALRHGLIPNLLDDGNRPRYNCRDACWWFIRAAHQYARATKDYDIFKSKVELMFLANDNFEHDKLKAEGKKNIKLLQDIIQEIFQSHIDGISFREWNAGYEIDSNMTSQGFNIQLKVNLQNGFICGGNQYNCLTWMDKMGSSYQAGTKGVPATPRAGAPIELVGLLWYCLESYKKLFDEGFYSYGKIRVLDREISYCQWSKRIKANFDKQFYLPQRQNRQNPYIRGIYKDLVHSPIEYDEQRFRPNALIAMAISPQLFVKEHALSYIQKVQTHLLCDKSIGISTLSNIHSCYASYYDSNDNSSNPKTAHGFSYHNGPQWVWLYGYYIVAKINFTEGIDKKRILGLLQEHVKYIESDEWCSLPQITNKNAQSNYFSCNAQAWSISSLLLALEKIHSLA